MTRPGKNNQLILPTMMLSLAIFLGLLFLMAARLAHGSDPAVGAAKTGQAQLTVDRRVVVKKKVVWKTPKPKVVQPGSSPVVSSAPAQSYSAPVQSYSAPTPSPAPAPAPAQTQSS